MLWCENSQFVLFKETKLTRIQDAPVGIATVMGWTIGVRFRKGQDFLFFITSTKALQAHQDS